MTDETNKGSMTAFADTMCSTTSPELKAPPKFVGGPVRYRTVTLECPIEYDGVVYAEVVVTRLTAADVAAFEAQLDALRATQPDARVRWPLFRDAGGAPIPDVVLDALDADDKHEVDKAAASFLPRAYRAEPDGGSPRNTGGSTAPPSNA